MQLGVEVMKTYNPDLKERLQSHMHFGLNINDDDEGSLENDVRENRDLSINQLKPIMLIELRSETVSCLRPDEGATYGFNLNEDLRLHCYIEGDLEIRHDVDLRLNVACEGCEIGHHDLAKVVGTSVSVRSLEVHVFTCIRGNRTGTQDETLKLVIEVASLAH